MWQVKDACAGSTILSLRRSMLITRFCFAKKHSIFAKKHSNHSIFPIFSWRSILSLWRSILITRFRDGFCPFFWPNLPVTLPFFFRSFGGYFWPFLWLFSGFFCLFVVFLPLLSTPHQMDFSREEAFYFRDGFASKDSILRRFLPIFSVAIYPSRCPFFFRPLFGLFFVLFAIIWLIFWLFLVFLSLLSTPYIFVSS